MFLLEDKANWKKNSTNTYAFFLTEYSAACIFSFINFIFEWQLMKNKLFTEVLLTQVQNSVNS